MGYVDKFTSKTFLYNHFNLHLQYQAHPTDASTKYIVGFEVYPSAYVEKEPLTCHRALRFSNFVASIMQIHA